MGRLQWYAAGLGIGAMVAGLTLAGGLGQTTPAEAQSAACSAHEVVLQPGWNLVAWTGAPTPVEDATATVAGSFQDLFVYDLTLNPPTGGWRSYNPNLPPALRSFSEFQTNQPLWVRVSAAGGAIWRQPVAANEGRTLSLRSGWNLIAWAGPDGTASADAFAEIASLLTSAYAWDAATQRYVNYYPHLPQLSNLTALRYGQGVWLSMAGAAQLSLPAPGAACGVTVGTGAVQITLAWTTDYHDVDLWVTEPGGERIWYQNTISDSGGWLDLDDQDGFGPENVFWPEPNPNVVPPVGPPPGEYEIRVNLYNDRNSPFDDEDPLFVPIPFNVRLTVAGNTQTFSGWLTEENSENDIARTVLVGRFTVTDGEAPPVTGTELSQWAASAVASSDYNCQSQACNNPANDVPAPEAVGAPDVTTCRDYDDRAWTPVSNGPLEEWLETSYTTPVYATGVDIYETFNSGSVVRIDLIEASDSSYPGIGRPGGYSRPHTIWTGADTTGCPGVLRVTFPRTSYLANRVIIWTEIDGWEEIDAVQLIGVTPE